MKLIQRLRRSILKRMRNRRAGPEKWRTEGIFRSYLLQCSNSNSSVRIHLGCGTNYLQGWFNIDNNSDKNIDKLDLNCDLTRMLPVPDDCVDFIYCEHFLEHLSVEAGQVLLRECIRILKPTGVARIAMPNLADSVALYNNPDWRQDPTVVQFNMQFVETRAELINMAFRNWGHQWLYDAEELERRLKQAGTQRIVFCELGKSEYAELRGLETRCASTLVAEFMKSSNLAV